ncbi:MAG: hypothetical protein OEZ55_09870 [Nitrospinota bacterium]|nr:hypothetical protein [Nitrospinota bacterium]
MIALSTMDFSARGHRVGGFFLHGSLLGYFSMSRVLLMAAILCAPSFFAPGAAMAQAEGSKNVISMDLRIFQNYLNLEYQRVTSDTFAWTVRGKYWYVEEMKTWNIELTGLGVGFRKYTQGNAPAGGYMGASLDIAQVSAGTFDPYNPSEPPVDLQRAWYIVPSATVGYAWYVDYFFIDIMLGMDYFPGGIQPRYEGDDTFPMKGPVFYGTLGVGVPF